LNLLKGFTKIVLVKLLKKASKSLTKTKTKGFARNPTKYEAD